MIKLTLTTDRPTYVKADAILSIIWLDDRTEVQMLGDLCFDVKEVPEQILALMDRGQVERKWMETPEGIRFER